MVSFQTCHLVHSRRRVLPHKVFIFYKKSKNSSKKTTERMLSKLFASACKTQLYKFGILCTLCHYLSANFPAKIIMIFSCASYWLGINVKKVEKVRTNIFLVLWSERKIIKCFPRQRIHLFCSFGLQERIVNRLKSGNTQGCTFPVTKALRHGEPQINWLNKAPMFVTTLRNPWAR